MPGITFVLAGDGDLRSTLEHAAATPNIAHVVFAGYRRDVARLLASCDLVIHPSLADALPTALIHALGGGTTDHRVQGRRDSGDRHRECRAFSSPPATSKCLVDAIETLAADPDLRSALGARAREPLRRASSSSHDG